MPIVDKVFFGEGEECVYFVIFDVYEDTFFEFVVDVVEGVDDVITTLPDDEIISIGTNQFLAKLGANDLVLLPAHG